MPNPVAWWEIAVSDGPKAVAFYRGLFGWTITETPQYNEVARSTGGIGGGIRPAMPGQPPMISFSVLVDSLDVTLERVVKAGGRVAMPPVPLGEGAAFAFFMDPDGNIVGVYWERDANAGTLSHAVPAPGGDTPPVMWWEIVVRDIGKAMAFYTQVFDWRISAAPGYATVAAGGGGIAGGIRQSESRKPPTVVLFVEVPDLAASIAQATALGGAVSLPPTPFGEGNKLAYITDADGNTLGLFGHRSSGRPTAPPPSAPRTPSV